jgi:16S rRNA (adenine1518-N6/adenine1519-N6)-dimethyltransferase
LGQHFLTDLGVARRIVEAVSGSRIASGSGGGVAVVSHGVSETVAGEGAGSSGGLGYGSGEAKVAVPEIAPRSGKVAVLEIGGGMGVLTQFLLERDDITLWGIEIDRESIAYMREHFPGFATGSAGAPEPDSVAVAGFATDQVSELATGSVQGAGDISACGDVSTTTGAIGMTGTGRLIEGDFLKFDLRGAFPREKFSDGVRIVGNFPYNISSQIFFKVLENRDLVPEVVGMVQREVAQRIAEPPGSRTYGILSVLLQAWYDIEYLFTVSEGVFSPPPKVKSAVIRLRRNSTTNLGCDEALFVKVVKASFGQRRKMLRNSLGAVFGDFGGAEHPLFTDRAEKLSVAQFVELTNWVAERMPKS